MATNYGLCIVIALLSSVTVMVRGCAWCRGWNVGLGSNDFVPYLILSNWHSNDVAAAQSSSSSSVNTSYSSTSFSGAGGSSGW